MIRTFRYQYKIIYKNDYPRPIYLGDKRDSLYLNPGENIELPSDIVVEFFLKHSDCYKPVGKYGGNKKVVK